jgi:hypothetical protein
MLRTSSSAEPVYSADRPKSEIFRSDFSSSSKFSGFRSRWHTPMPWQYLRGGGRSKRAQKKRRGGWQGAAGAQQPTAETGAHE